MDSTHSIRWTFKRMLANILSVSAVLAIALANTGAAVQAAQPTLPAAWDANAVRKPGVLQETDGYKMWYDGLDKDNQTRVGLATSTDGASWKKYLDNPVLDAGPAGAWDAWGEHAPFVIKDGDLYKMWYEGQASENSVRQLGYATSSDGITWTKYEGNPVLRAGPEEYDNQVAGHGTVLHEDGGYKLWYHATGSNGVLIAYATSPDGINWTKMGPVLRPEMGAWGENALWGPSVIKVGNMYWMWYSANSSTYGVSIGAATSLDGMMWVPVGDKPVLIAPPNRYFGDPHVILDSGNFKMWFGDFSDGKIYYTQSVDGLNWSPYTAALEPGPWHPLEGWHDWAAGNVDAGNCTASGWAVNPDNRDADVSVRVFSDGAEIATATASDYGEDMAREGICPGGTCRFNIGLWGLVTPDQEHQIMVQAYDPETDQWWNLEGTPKTLTCSPPPPVLTVSVSNNYVRADNFAPNATVTFTAYASSAPGEASMWSDSRTTDTNGFAIIWPWEAVPDLVVGNYVVATDGAKEKQLVLEAVTIDSFDPDTDVVTGTAPLAPAGRDVNVWAGNDVSPGCGMWVKADPLNGAWTADFKTQPCDVTWNMWGAATVYDGDRDATVYEKGPPPNPFVIAFPENDAVEAWEWPDGSAVYLSIDDPLTSAHPDYSADGTMAVTTWGDPRTYFRFEFAGAYDLRPGDIVSVTDGQRERSHTVRNLSVTEVSAAADTVAGTADAGAQVQIWPHGFDQTATVIASTGENRAWLANLTGLFDIVAGTGGRSQIQDEAGNSTAVDWYLPIPWFTAFPEGDQVEGWDWPLGADMYLTIDDPTTDLNPDFSKTGKVELAPWGSGQHWVWFEFRGAYDLKPGDIVRLTDGTTERTHVVQNLSVTSVDVIENTVTGMADPNTPVTLRAWEDPEGRRVEMTADDTGKWAGDFDDVGYNIQQYNTVRAEVWVDGNGTAVDRQTDYNYDIYIYDPPTGTIRQLTSSPDTDEYNPSWSPNGKLIAHDVVVRGASQSIYITDVKTGISTPLVGAEDGGNDAVWSPNGKWIAFDRNWAGGPNLYDVPATGGDPTVVREDAIGADWAPNGKRLVFQQPSDGSIRTVAVDGGSGRETLIAASGANPVWSPDGSWIAYENDGDIWKISVNVQGKTFGEAIRVTSLSAREEEPSWSADSQTIAFQTGLGGDYEIWTVPAAGGEATWLVGAVEYGDYSPAYAKNGAAVAYAGASAAGQAARLWAAAYTHEPGPWSQGAHSYHFADGAGEPTRDLSFEVSAGAQAYDGHVLLRPWAMRTCTDGTMQDIPRVIAPEQPTLFHIGYVTDLAMTYAEAQAYFNSLMPNVTWDGGEAVALVRHEIMPYQAEGRLADMCAYAQP